MSFQPAPHHRLADVVLTPFGTASVVNAGIATAPSSGTMTASQLLLMPLLLLDPFTVSKAFWCNGATVGTDSLDVGIYRMTDMTTGRCDLIRSTGAVVSAGTANVVQEVGTWKVAANLVSLTAGADSTDSTTYTTASVTLKAGRLYLLSIVNTAASAGAVSSIAGGPTWTSRATTQFNTTAHRVSIWSGVPTVDRTGTIVITFGATQTGARWVLDEFSGVDTTTNDGVVQGVTGTGNSTTPLATLAAFGSANNATYSANANTADSTTTPGAGFTELSDDTTAVTPAQFLQTQWRVDNDTTADGTITSGQWGAAAIEIKADASAFIIPPATVGSPDIYMAFTISGATATVFRVNSSIGLGGAGGTLTVASTFPLPSTLTATTGVQLSNTPLFGFSSRSLIG